MRRPLIRAASFCVCIEQAKLVGDVWNRRG